MIMFQSKIREVDLLKQHIGFAHCHPGPQFQFESFCGKAFATKDVEVIPVPESKEFVCFGCVMALSDYGYSVHEITVLHQKSEIQIRLPFLNNRISHAF